MITEQHQAELDKLRERQQHLRKGKSMAAWLIGILSVGVAWAVRELVALRPDGDWAIVGFSCYLLAVIGAFVFAKQELRVIDKKIKQLQSD